MEVVGDRYRLETVLGTGGTATVWLVHDLVLDRTAALKLLLPADSETRRERLRTEARALAALDHPRVVRVFDLGTHEDRDYIVMEYLERGSLADRLRQEGALAPAEAVALTLEVLDALGAAHHAGIVHRDVKPGNVLVRADGTVALCDFGIARTAEGGDTHTGVALGSIGFMAPEQRVDARRAGPQADLYATACTLYNLLTNDTPVDLYLAPDRSPRWEAVPPALRPILRRATRSEPSARFQTAEEMAEALRELLPSLGGLEAARPSRTPAVGHAPTRADEPSLQAERRDRAVDVEDWSWAKRDRPPVGRGALWVGVALTAAAASTFAALGPLRSQLVPDPAPIEAKAAPAPAPAPRLTGRWLGTLDGHPAELVLRGPGDALEGDLSLRLGSNQLQSKLRGRFDDGELALVETAPNNPATYRARLRPNGLVLEGQLVRDGQPAVPFALVLVE
jgi:serine/threonine-protein kinase